jgi:hypothetical protein
MDRAALEALGREQLIQEARRFGVRRPEVMTRVELIDEVLRLATPNPVERKRVRGWLGVARDLVADIVEQGLNLPDAAALIRGDVKFEPLKPVQPPVATVTLAEIYGAQGHFQKALAMLNEVLAKEPDHDAARKLRDRLEREGGAGGRSATSGEDVAAVVPEEPEPPTPRQALAELPAFATAHVPSEDNEPLTPRRLSKQPPADAPTIADYDSEPLTPRRLSTPPPLEHQAVLLRATPTRAVIYFEIPEGHTNGDAPMVYVVEWRPGPVSVERVAHELVVSGSRGAVTVDGLSPDAVVRGAVGQKRHGRFKPLAVCAEVTVEGGNPTIVWSPRAGRDYGPVAQRCAGHVSA